MLFVDEVWKMMVWLKCIVPLLWDWYF